jgi:hypothetical protein
MQVGRRGVRMYNWYLGRRIYEKWIHLYGQVWWQHVRSTVLWTLWTILAVLIVLMIMNLAQRAKANQRAGPRRPGEVVRAPADTGDHAAAHPPRKAA